ncbi:Npun_F0296 family exosortase-dependent surface protein [Ketobacter alkanivorans]|uniref:PEP-CTERM protein-sorting domain-containing protein n=1 Tax=Ketobacter alkanivorans TaxID=1917421 RepID=A0A2K9LJ11_9GAMM|nr:PEP-CTERM sorting domain-containing protein [Ketobacter alkanivorans]AUM12227.1 hypothetical protein Kalk_07295 [Ketobacter alkanivorans]MCP5014800.1 PEP-CTERM sorting domain-containing protein [Ketobacter sp.]
MSSLRSVIGFAFLVVSFSASSAIDYSVSGAGVYTSAVAGATTMDFNSGACNAGVSCSGAGQIVIGSASGLYAQPFGTSSAYLSVPNPTSSGTYTIGLNGDYNYYGLYWGSIDSYNSIAFYLGGSLVGGFSGSDLGPLLADGNQGSWSSNRYINFMFTGGDLFDTVALTSTNFAFESDNHAYARVPEPPVFVLLAVGLVGLVFTRRHLMHG